MYRLTILLLVIFLTPACLNMSSYQTAQVLPSGEKSATMALTMTKVAPSANDVDVIYEEVSFVTPEFMMRGGIGHNMEVGARAWLAFPFIGVAADFKYQLVDSNAVDLAFDIGASYYGLETVDSDVDFVDIMPAVMMTFPKIGLTITPKQIYRSITATNAADDSQVYTGASVSLALGKNQHIIPEVGYFEGEGNEFTYWGIGFRF